MEEKSLLEGLTSIFQQIKSTGEFISLKIWTGEDQKLKFFLSNTPPRKFSERDKSLNAPQNSATVPIPDSPNNTPVAQSSPSVVTRSKKRKITKLQTPEIVRSTMVDNDEKNISAIEDSRPQPAIPFFNHYSTLQDVPADEDEDDDPVLQTKDDDDADDGPDGEDGAADGNKLDVTAAEPVNENRLCNWCEKRRVTGPWTRWFSKECMHALSNRR